MRERRCVPWLRYGTYQKTLKIVQSNLNEHWILLAQFRFIDGVSLHNHLEDALPDSSQHANNNRFLLPRAHGFFRKTRQNLELLFKSSANHHLHLRSPTRIAYLVSGNLRCSWGFVGLSAMVEKKLLSGIRFCGKGSIKCKGYPFKQWPQDMSFMTPAVDQSGTAWIIRASVPDWLVYNLPDASHLYLNSYYSYSKHKLCLLK